MTSPRERRKARRRAEKTMDEAFEALLAERLPLAEKLARRAVAAGEMNARLWLDLGRILRRRDGQDEDAEAALRRAIALSPDYGEAFAELAAFQAAAGKWVQAERLQRRAVELLPRDPTAVEKLASYAARVVEPAPAGEPGDEPPPPPTARTERYAWGDVAAELLGRGAVVLPNLLDADERAGLRGLWEVECFESSAVATDEDGGFECRWFARPLPRLVEELRVEVYARLLPIAAEYQRRLERRARFPASLARFLLECADAGQHRAGPGLLRLPAGGFRAPAREAELRVAFPFRLEVRLGPGPADHEGGGALRLLDVRGRRKPRAHEFASGLGDGVVFCARERIIEIAGVAAAQPVLCGTAECATEQLVLAVPFHDAG